MNRFITLFLALYSSAPFGLANDLPTLTAETGHPVVPELMGGCSMKCAFPWTVEATEPGKGKPYKVAVLNDEKPAPAWMPRQAGIGAKLTFHFPKKLPAEMEDNVPFYGFDMINGDWASDAKWKASARVKKGRMYYNNKPLYNVLFADTRRWQHVHFDDIMVHSGDSMTLEILEVYPGEKSAPVAISELVLQGAH
jgi:hypothetical protein